MSFRYSRDIEGVPSEWRKEKRREAIKHGLLVLALIVCFIIVTILG